ncbi:MAG: acetylxylan esterase [Caldilineaceae bacterium]|nr:acetylxylan esterase [Caldilineaceae bacterium]
MQSFSAHVNGYYDVADQLPHYLRQAAEVALAQQLAQKAAFTTVAQFEAYRTQVRDHFLAAIGGLPTVKTPLNVQCRGTIIQARYTIEKIVYESVPNFFVTTALYVPTGLTAPAPAVVFVHGHSDLGKGYPEYQAVCIDLVLNGFVVLAVDPPGQGERKQYYDPATGQLHLPQCTTEHTHSGLQYVVSGASLARQFIWDVVRGVDYLESRTDVDATRIGVTGNSGGGTQTSFLMMAEPRFAAAVPCTFIMTLASYLKSGQPQDSEQVVRGCLVDGPDHDDYLTLMAPKPVLVGAAAYDFFPIEGTHEAVARAKAIYQLYGAEDRVALTVAAHGHAYSPQLREAAVNWFRQHLQGTAPDFRTGQIDLLPPEALWCTATGHVLAQWPGSRTVFELNQAWLKMHGWQRQPVTAPAALSAHVQAMRAAVPRVLGMDLHQRTAPIYPRVIWQGEIHGYAAEKIFFLSEPEIVITGVLLHPKGTAVQTDLVILAQGTAELAAQLPRLQALLAANHRVFVSDVRGVGAVQTRTVTASAPPHDTEYKLACDAMMLKRSTLGMRVFDVLRAYDYLRSRADVTAIGIVGVESGAIFAYFAAALEPGMTALTFDQLLFSYQDLVETRLYDRQRYNLSVMAWGILQHFDLVDLLPCLAPRSCTFINLCNAKGEAQTGVAFLAVATAHGYLPPGWCPIIHMA